MIDWLNFGLEGLFFGVAVLFMWQALAKTSVLYFVLGVLFLGILTTAPPPFISFNPTVHECTEWECTLGDFLIQDNQNGNWHCSFYDEGIYDTGLRVSHITDEKEPISECVSFRAKTECEKGNNEYKVVGGDVYFFYDVINKFGGEKNFIRNYNKRNSPQIIKIWHVDEYQGIGAEFCIRKSVEELEADYCEENPKDGGDNGRCYCTNKGNKYWVTYDMNNRSLGNETWLAALWSEEEISELMAMWTETFSRRHERNITFVYEPFDFTGDCVSAVPLSEKLYCDENPTSGKCDCAESKTEEVENPKIAEGCRKKTEDYCYQQCLIQETCLKNDFTQEDNCATQEGCETSCYWKEYPPCSGFIADKHGFYINQTSCVRAVPKVTG